MPAARSAFIAAVARDPALRRIEAGFLLFSMGEWASWLAIVVYAFSRGGPAEAGVIGFAVSAPSILVAPTASILGDRWPRARVLLGTYVLQAVTMAATALALALGSAVLGYVLAVIASTIVGLSRPALASLLPEVASTPDDLTAGNVASGMAEGAGALAGPLVAGPLLAIGGPPLVYVATAGGLAVAAVALLPIARVRRSRPRVELTAHSSGAAALARALARELTAGGAAVLADRRLTAVFAVLAASIGLLGALSVFIVVIAIDVLGLDQAAVGYLTAATGLGALIGSAASVVLVGRERLGLPLVGAAVFFGLSVAALGLTRDPLAVGIVLVATGLGWSFAYVAATTLTQRLAGDDVMTRVFGVSEAVTTGAEAIGGLTVPVLIVLLGPTGALIAAGLALPVVVLLAAPAFLRADRADPAFLRDLRIVRAVPMFTPLSGRVLERLAGDAVRLSLGAGTSIIRAGEMGDRFYVIVAGRAEVEVAGRANRFLEAGDAFGEIALLHDVPRSATVRTLEPTELLAIERAPFLEALTGQARSHVLAAEVATMRLAADGSEGPGAD